MKTYFYLFIFFLLSNTLLAQWIGRTSSTTNNLRGADYIDAYHISVVGDLGTILRSSNSGISWFFQQSYTTANLFSVDFVDEFFGIVVGANGTILRTTDGGSNWATQNSGTEISLNGIYCLGNLNCIAVGNDGTILRTTDSGITWQIIPSGVIRNLFSVSFADSNNGIAVGVFTRLKSTDGGAQWTTIIADTNYNLRDVCFCDHSTIIAVGASGTIIKSTNSGQTWVKQTSGISNMLYGISCVDNLYGGTAGALGKILGTQDGGMTWMGQNGWTNRDLYSISFVNPDTGIVVGANGVIRTTFTAGIPVELISFNATAEGDRVILEWITASELNNHIFEIERRTEDQEFYTIGFVEGNGTTTEYHDYTYTDNHLERGEYLYRLKQIDYLGTFQYSDELKVNVTAVIEFSLGQNYPNPFNPNTVISYQLPVNSNVTLKVYDVLGNEIATLVNEEKHPGTYEVEFTLESSIKHSASGIYFYQLKVGNPLTGSGQVYLETKKMVLLK